MDVNDVDELNYELYYQYFDLDELEMIELMNIDVDLMLEIYHLENDEDLENRFLNDYFL